MRNRLLIAARSIVLGWAALFAITYLLEGPLLSWTAPLLGASWIATAQLALVCSGLAMTGWIVGRWNRNHVLVFAALLAIWNFGLVPIDLPWLFRLMVNTLRDARYLESFITSAATHALLFGSLVAGANLTRARQPTILHIK
jgi:hypothetical protein